MKPAIVDSVEAYNHAKDAIEALLRDGDVAGAIALADSLLAGPDQEANVENLRACAYVDGGSQLKRLDLLEKGSHIWCNLTPCYSPHITYNLASANLEIWQLSVEKTDPATAWRDRRSNLHEARKLFKCVADDEGAPTELRLKAHTDVGNSYDIVGRHSMLSLTMIRPSGLTHRSAWPLAIVGSLFFMLPHLWDRTSRTCWLKLPRFWRLSVIEKACCRLVANRHSINS